MAQRIHYKTVEQLQTSARKDCFIHDDDEFQTMLSFYHDLGLIIKHRSTVVLEAKWLIDLFKGLITIPRFDKAVRKKSRRKIFPVVTLAIQLLRRTKRNAGFCCTKLYLKS